MKRPLAYLTAAWSGEPDVDMELAAHYCRLAYEAGFSPICPLLYLPLFLNDSVPEEHKAGIDMRRDMLRRSHTLIVCGSVVDEDVKNDIAVAGRLGIAATTLEGVLAVKGHGTPGYRPVHERKEHSHHRPADPPLPGNVPGRGVPGSGPLLHQNH